MGRSSWNLLGQEATWLCSSARGTLCVALKGQVASVRATCGLFWGRVCVRREESEERQEALGWGGPSALELTDPWPPSRP